jgi:hypothetical protein
LVTGAVVFVIHVVARSLVTAGPDPSVFAKTIFWVPINVLGAVGALLVVLGWPVLYRTFEGHSASSTIGLILLAAAWTFFGLFLSLYGMLVLPWLADRAPSVIAPGAPLPVTFVVTFVIALLAWLVGTVLIALPFVRRRTRPSWVGYALIFSGAWIVVGNLIAPTGPASNLALNLLSNMAPVLLMTAIGYLGYGQWRANGPGAAGSTSRRDD